MQILRQPVWARFLPSADKEKGNLNCCMNCPLQAQKDQRQSCRCTPWKMWGQDTRNAITRATTYLIQFTIVTIRRKDFKKCRFQNCMDVMFSKPHIFL